MFKKCYRKQSPHHQIQYSNEDEDEDTTNSEQIPNEEEININLLQEEEEKKETNWSKIKLQFFILMKFFPYLWPKGKWNIKFRIIISFLFLFASKGVGLAVPFAYKGTVDHLTSKDIKLTIPWIPILLFGFGKLISNALANLVDSTFLPVTQNALKEISIETCKTS